MTPAGASTTPGFFTRPETEKLRKPLRSWRPCAGHPGRALFDDVAHPVERLDVLLERRAAEQADLRDIRRAVARQAAFALDRFDHRRLFAADVGAGAAPQMQLGVRRQARRLDLGDFVGQHQAQFGIFVADVEIGVRRLDHPGRDQHAFDEAVRVAFEIIAVLEGARLALVGIDREQARRRLRAHQLPFAPGRKAGAAEPAQAGVADELDQFVARAFARRDNPSAARSRRLSGRRRNRRPGSRRADADWLSPRPRLCRPSR